MTKRNASKLSMTPPSARTPAGAEKRGRAADDAKALAEGKKRLTLDMPEKAHRALKLLATEKGKSMNDFIMEALKERGLRWDD
jgi:hypothetical protein